MSSKFVVKAVKGVQEVFEGLNILYALEFTYAG
jgi:hypothetical protein